MFLIAMNRRRARYAIAFTNLDVLASVAETQRARLTDTGRKAFLGHIAALQEIVAAAAPPPDPV